DVQVPGHLLHADGEVGALHLTGKSAAQALIGAFDAENCDLIFGIISRQKKREALDMIPVRVRNQYMNRHRLLAEFRVQCQTKPPNSSASIENNDFVTDSHLYA